MVNIEALDGVRFCRWDACQQRGLGWCGEEVEDGGSSMLLCLLHRSRGNVEQ